jgi:hypothetical protein
MTDKQAGFKTANLKDILDECKGKRDCDVKARCHVAYLIGFFLENK